MQCNIIALQCICNVAMLPSYSIATQWEFNVLLHDHIGVAVEMRTVHYNAIAIAMHGTALVNCKAM